MYVRYVRTCPHNPTHYASSPSGWPPQGFFWLLSAPPSAVACACATWGAVAGQLQGRTADHTWLKATDLVHTVSVCLVILNANLKQHTRYIKEQTPSLCLPDYPDQLLSHQRLCMCMHVCRQVQEDHCTIFPLLSLRSIPSCTLAQWQTQCCAVQV